MKEVTKEQFKEIYFKLGGGEDPDKRWCSG
jgi:hypothetical protein